MFKTSQEFTFSIGQGNSQCNFTGKLVFESDSINMIGTLHTEEELSTFGALLNESLSIPDYWTLEILAELLFNYARPVFSNLKTVVVLVTEQPQRVSEYRNDTWVDFTTDGELVSDILELEAVG